MSDENSPDYKAYIDGEAKKRKTKSRAKPIVRATNNANALKWLFNQSPEVQDHIAILYAEQLGCPRDEVIWDRETIGDDELIWVWNTFGRDM